MVFIHTSFHVRVSQLGDIEMNINALEQMNAKIHIRCIWKIESNFAPHRLVEALSCRHAIEVYAQNTWTRSLTKKKSPSQEGIRNI